MRGIGRWGVLGAMLLGVVPWIEAGVATSARTVTVTTPDGLKIAAQVWGNPDGREILFIHGTTQAGLSWMRQVTDAELAREFKMVVYDLRGHGASDKPTDPAAYKETKRWADEVQAVIDQTGLKKPVAVAWSYGGRVIADYLSVHGDAKLAGIDFVAATVKADDPSLFGPGVKGLAGLNSPDLWTNIEATRAFLRDCFSKQPEPADFERMLAFNMVVPAYVRSGIGGRPAPYDAVLRAVKVPALVTHGEEDRLVLPAMGRYIASVVPGAKLSLYAGTGHSTFWEEPARFNRELAAFVRGASGAP